MKRRPKTIKEKKFVNEYLKTGNATEAAARVYDVSTRNSAKSIGYENLTKLDFPTILDNAGITDDFIAKTLRRGMKAKKTISISGKEADAGTNDFIDIPDWANRLKATELATKAKGHLKENINFNIKLKPKFVMSENETSKV